jgi:alpha-tubulin N-acetyltransferase 1|tara:strand:+ start:339 stop:590 length:252 start_codon:yes stop_codon:yes gene_type:complete
MIKVGKRNLFIRNDTGSIKEIKPICVLDFYVHESVQRGGHGRALFDFMLHNEKASPEKLGYDRPSEKLIGFCAKHFGLKKYTP